MAGLLCASIYPFSDFTFIPVNEYIYLKPDGVMKAPTKRGTSMEITAIVKSIK